MKRVFIGTLVGTVVAFMYGFVTWGVFGGFDAKMQPVPASIDYKSLGATVAADGAYFFPPVDIAKMKQLERDDPAAAEKANAEYSELHERGPVGWILIRKGGTPIMDGATFATGICADALCAALMSILLVATARSTWIGRWGFGLAAAAFAAVAANGNDLAWFKFPQDYVMADAADMFLKWGVTSAVIAACIGAGRSGGKAS